MKYAHMQTMKTEKGEMIAEILWNVDKQCFAIRNYNTLKITNYKTQKAMAREWEKIQYEFERYYGLKVISC